MKHLASSISGANKPKFQINIDAGFAPKVKKKTHFAIGNVFKPFPVLKVDMVI